MSKLLNLSPKSSFNTAPKPAKAIYLLLFGLALIIQLAAITQGRLLGASFSTLMSVLVFISAIFVHDFGLMVLRQNPLSRKGILLLNVTLIFTLTRGREIEVIPVIVMLMAATAYLLTHTPSLRAYLRKPDRKKA